MVMVGWGFDCIGIGMYWYVLVYWFIGVLVYWFVGVLVCWFIGLSVHWSRIWSRIWLRWGIGGY